MKCNHNMVNVLHITPHLGGGVGTVLMELIPKLHLCSDYYHEVISLEYANKKAKEWSLREKIPLSERIAPSSEELHEKMMTADIVHLHYWNHPLLYLLLHSFSGKARIVMWSHVNGYYAPYLFNDKILKYPEVFVTTTDYSLKQRNIQDMDKEWKNRHVRSIPSCSGAGNFLKIKPQPHNTFNIGYVGTVDYCKMYKNVLGICSGINIPDVLFTFVGGDAHKDMEKDALNRGLADRCTFTGKVDNVKPYYALFDIFLYPLNRDNYGTGEQVLIEAMSAGIPQVVFAGGAEEYVVQDGITGFVVKDEREFIESIEKLYKDCELREKMSLSSKLYAGKHHTIKNSVEKWLDLYRDLLKRPKKRSVLCTNDKTDIGLSLYYLAQGNSEASQFYKKIEKFYPGRVPDELIDLWDKLSPIHKSMTKGSIKHYNTFFNEKKLRYLASIN